MAQLNKKNIEDIFALASMQEGMLLHYLKNPHSEHYIEQLSLDISGKIEREIFEKTWNTVTRANEMLRTVFRWEKVENPIQLTLKEYRLKPVYYDFSDETVADGETWLEGIKSKDREKEFDLTEVPFRVTLCKIEEDRYEMIICNHHILYDGWSNGIILREFFETYNALSLPHGNIPGKPAKTKFKEYIRFVQNRDTTGEESFWRNYLKGVNTQTELSVKRRRVKPGKGAATYLTGLGKNPTGELSDFVRTHKITFASLIYGAWGILLQKYNNAEDVVFGTTVAGRNTRVRGIEHIVGLFINTLPMRVRGRWGEKIREFLPGINEDLQKRKEYDTVPLVRIKEYSEIDNSEELFDTLVVIENYPLSKQLDPGNGKLIVNSYSMVEYPPYDLTVGISASDETELIFYYREQRFHRDTIRQLSRHFTFILQDILKNPGKTVTDIELMPGEEKRRLLSVLNGGEVGYPRGETVHRLFEKQAAAFPHRIAVVGEASVTYRHLDRRADRLAHRLRQSGVSPDTLVGIVADRSTSLIAGILGILKAGGAYMPVDPTYPEERINYMLRDSGTGILLGKMGELSKLSEDIEMMDPGKNYPDEQPAPIRPLTHSPTHVCYVIYTSGTTGKPKGTLIEHRNVVRLMVNDKFQFDFNAHDVWTMFHSPCFDFSVWEMYGALLYGGKLVLVPKPVAMEPPVYLSLLKREGVTVLNQTPTAFYSLADEELKHEDRHLLIRYVIFGGEALQPGKLARWKEKYPGTMLVNMFGITETTVHVTYKEITHREIAGNISNIGLPIPTLSCYVMDRHLNPMPMGAPGELYVGGDGVARGYLNKPELTAQKFIKDPLNPDRELYKSGDLARFRHEEELEYAGRMDHQVKIRGFRIELGEIENQLLKHPQIKEVVVLAAEKDDNDKYLCAYVVPHPDVPLDIARLREFLSLELPDYMIPSYFVPLETIPMTSNGKVDRKALQGYGVQAVPGIGGTCGNRTAPRDRVEDQLAVIWSGVLGIEKDAIGIEEDFFQLGAHSLKAAAVVAKIQKTFNIKLPLAEMFERPTIKEMAAYIGGLAEVKYTSPEPLEKKEYYPLSSAQKRIYLHHQMEEGGVGYNIPSAWTLEGDIGGGKLEQIFKTLIHRQESLRTSFDMIDGEPVQRIHPDAAFGVEYYDTPDTFIRPFDLSRAPLLRVGLIPQGPDKYGFMVDVHHIVTDGVSMKILIREFVDLWTGRKPEPLRLQYKDFACRELQPAASGEITGQEEYWSRQFKQPVPVLELPTDYERPAELSFEGDTLLLTVGREEIAGLKKLADAENATLYMVLLSILYILLGKIGKQEDIVIGTNTSGRRYPEQENVIGMFVNTLPLRNRLDGDQTFTRFLEEVKKNTLTAFENQDYPFDRLVETMGGDRDSTRNPLFDILFQFFEEEIAQVVQAPGLKLTPGDDEGTVSKFDLNIVAIGRDENLTIRFRYSKSLFKRETVSDFVRYYETIIAAVTGDPGKKLSEIKLISEEERGQILEDFNDDLEHE